MISTRPKNLVNLIFRAFSDRTRLRILSLLGEGESCVGDLVEVLKVPQPKVSRHLAYLRKAGLVIAREDGLWNFYRLAPASTLDTILVLGDKACVLKCDIVYSDRPENEAAFAYSGLKFRDLTYRDIKGLEDYLLRFRRKIVATS